MDRAQTGVFAPATQCDLFIWLVDDAFANLFDRSRNVVDQLARAGAPLVDQTLGFDYHNSHDLIGFEDGTANPNGDAMPPTSHVSRTDLKIGGVAQKIFRRSMPYGNMRHHGLYFFAFACSLERIQVQLQSMYDVAGSGVYDHLLNYSKAVSGSYWFAPARADLEKLIQ